MASGWVFPEYSINYTTSVAKSGYVIDGMFWILLANSKGYAPAIAGIWGGEGGGLAKGLSKLKFWLIISPYKAPGRCLSTVDPLNTQFQGLCELKRA